MAETPRSRRLDLPREPRRLRLPRFDPEDFGKWSEAIARFMGTAKFLVYMTVVIVIWIAWNALAPARLRFDPYTFTFLTLMLSLQASYAAPLILLAQNRQADRDRVALEEDRRRAAMQKADTEYLAREIAAVRIALGDVATRDFLRSELTRLAEELGAASPDGGREVPMRRQKLMRKEHRRQLRREAEVDAAEADAAEAEAAEAAAAEAEEAAAAEAEEAPAAEAEEAQAEAPAAQPEEAPAPEPKVTKGRSTARKSGPDQRKASRASRG